MAGWRAQLLSLQTNTVGCYAGLASSLGHFWEHQGSRSEHSEPAHQLFTEVRELCKHTVSSPGENTTSLKIATSHSLVCSLHLLYLFVACVSV